MAAYSEKAEKATDLQLSDAHFHLGFVLDLIDFAADAQRAGRSSLPRRLPLASIEIPKGRFAARLTSLRRTPARPTRTPKGRFAARLIPARRKLRQPLGQPRERSVERQLLHGKLLIPPSSSLRWDCIPGGFPRTKAVLQKNCVHSIALCPKRATWVKLAWTSRSAE